MGISLENKPCQIIRQPILPYSSAETFSCSSTPVGNDDLLVIGTWFSSLCVISDPSSLVSGSSFVYLVTEKFDNSWRLMKEYSWEDPCYDSMIILLSKSGKFTRKWKQCKLKHTLILFLNHESSLACYIISI